MSISHRRTLPSVLPSYYQAIKLTKVALPSLLAESSRKVPLGSPKNDQKRAAFAPFRSRLFTNQQPKENGMQNIIATNDLRDNAPAQDHQTKHELTGCALDDLHPVEQHQTVAGRTLNGALANQGKPPVTAPVGGLWRTDGQTTHFVAGFGSVVTIQGPKGSGTSAVAFAVACSVRTDAAAMGFRSDAVKALFFDTAKTRSVEDWERVVQWRVPGSHGNLPEVEVIEAVKAIPDGVVGVELFQLFERAEKEQQTHGGPVMVVIDKVNQSLVQDGNAFYRRELAEVLASWAAATKNIVVVVDSDGPVFEGPGALVKKSAAVIYVNKTDEGRHFATFTKARFASKHMHIDLEYNGRFLDAIDTDEPEEIAEAEQPTVPTPVEKRPLRLAPTLIGRIRSFTVISSMRWLGGSIAHGSEVTCLAEEVTADHVGRVVAVFTESFDWKFGRLLGFEPGSRAMTVPSRAWSLSGQTLDEVTIQADGEPECLAARSVFLVASIATDFETNEEEDPGNDAE